MITIVNGSRLRFSFPEIHRDAICEISFDRTFRVSDDGNVYELPPPLGKLPIRHLDDYQPHLPQSVHEKGCHPDLRPPDEKGKISRART